MTISTKSNSQGNYVAHEIVIVGGGAAGITVASQLLAKNKNLDIAIIEPSDKHYYQPAWTLVGAGEYNIEDTAKNQKDCIPAGVNWIQAYVEKFEPENNLVITKDEQTIKYQYLIVCPGIQINWQAIKGLPEALGKNGVTSNYDKKHAPYTWELIKNFSGGKALFTFPATPIKCAGAPQKIMYLADDAFRRQGVREKTEITYFTPGAKVFAVPEYCTSLEKVIERKNIDVKYKHNLQEIKADTKEAIFSFTSDNGTEEVSFQYDFIHVTPPMSPPDFIKNSPLAVKEGTGIGWVDVNKYTLQHNVYPNIFSLGDASSLPTSRTAAAIRQQAPVLVTNLLALIAQKELNSQYNGYSCCPLITGYGKTIMAEFDYDLKPMSTFGFDPTQERWTMWILKRHILPWVYWNRMLKGKAFEGEMLQFLK